MASLLWSTLVLYGLLRAILGLSRALVGAWLR